MITYEDAGVSIANSDLFTQRIKSIVRTTYNDKVISGVGGFCALYEVSKTKWLASGTDGVGTKVKLASELDFHEEIGKDLVGMCANDIICSGASPSFFLDYLATGKLDISIHEKIIKSIADACLISEMALIGGETAEMPGVYANNIYDLAGFAIGELGPSEHISGKKIEVGNELIGLFSSGFHSNGFSLIRKLINQDDSFEFKKELLTGTELYWPILKLILSNQRENILGLAHITGGGFENIGRMNSEFSYLINHVRRIDDLPHSMKKIIMRSNLSLEELYKTFNMGIGFVICVKNKDKINSFLSSMNVNHINLGTVINKSNKDVILNF